MNDQLTLFDLRAEPARIEPCDPHVTEPAERKRLTKQTLEVFNALVAAGRQGMTNRALAAMALNYRARISDIRKARYTVECFDEDHKTGLSYYRILNP